MAQEASTRRAPRSRLVRAALFALALAAVAGLGATTSGCGGSNPEGVAQIETTETTTTQSDSQGRSGERPASGDPAAYAACMRRNGVPNFPDPEGDKVRIDKGLQDTPQFSAADNACRSLRPGGKVSPRSPQQRAEAQRRALRYAACMREHGVPNFPDPLVTADGRFDLPAGVHLDEDSPRYRAAAQACIELGRGAKGALGEPSGGQGSTP